LSRRRPGDTVSIPRTRIVPKTKECPMCAETMHLRENTTTVRVPGNPNATTRTTREWVCRECDYFEEADEDGVDERRPR
jgi:rubredoxin